MEQSERGQISKNAAEIYEEFFLPALFTQWAPIVVKDAQVSEGDKVVDVACGTGVVAREAARIAGSEGHVVGVDMNEGMLSVAKKIAPNLEWKYGFAEDLPLEDNRYDAVICQFGLMFFEDQVSALHEMMRVTRPGGRLVVTVWDDLENSPGYAMMTSLLDELFGEDAANALRAPYSLGNVDRLARLYNDAKIDNFSISTLKGYATFPSIDSWVYTDIKGWTLSEMINDKYYKLLLSEAKVVLKEYVGEDGKVIFPAPAHVVKVTKLEHH